MSYYFLVEPTGTEDIVRITGKVVSDTPPEGDENLAWYPAGSAQVLNSHDAGDSIDIATGDFIEGAVDRYAVLDNQTGEAGKVIGVVKAKAPKNAGWVKLTSETAQVSSYWEYDGAGNFTYAEAPPPDYGTKMSVRAFLKRLSPQARKDILQKSKNDINLEDFLLLLRTSAYVDLADPDVTEGLDYLVATNTLTEAEKDVVLNSPVAVQELP